MFNLGQNFSVGNYWEIITVVLKQVRITFELIRSKVNCTFCTLQEYSHCFEVRR